MLAMTLVIDDATDGAFLTERDLAAELRAAGVVSVDASARRRAEYSTDASNYRVPPRVVVFPSATEEIASILEVARRLRVPLTMRGGGTSVAGNAIGPGIVVDTSRALNRVLSIDPEARTAHVEPGVTLGALQRAAGAHGLRFGPDPSTWARCTIGGMIGNNACGPHALAFGRTADNVVELRGFDGTGRTIDTRDGVAAVPGLVPLVDGALATIRTESGRFGRQISGYSLEHLLPENGRNLAAALTGTEGTCIVVTDAVVRLVPLPSDPTLVVLGYSDMAAAADDVPALVSVGAMAIEGLDARIVDAVRSRPGAAPVPELPAGRGWLLVEVASTAAMDARERAEQLIRAASTDAVLIAPPGPLARAIWKIREDGAGLSGRSPAGRPAWPGLEDAAVPPENLGAYLRDFDLLCAEHGIEGLPYGHFGDGCIHVRLDVPLDSDGSRLRAFMTDAAAVIARHGGSLSGEHGDGRARSELLSTMYSAPMLDLFAGFKNLFDPERILNPGVIVDPAPLDQDLRRPAARSILASGGFAFRHDGGSFTDAVHRCVGVGKCRVDNSASGGFMCPSFQATQDERNVTRGRARVLQEMISTGSTLDWRSPEVHDALDLCLSCKACGSDCPAGVDMATFKSEVLHRSYAGRLRPITHYSLGWLPRWARLVGPIAPVVNRLLAVRAVQRLVTLVGGIDARRSIPGFAQRPFRARVRGRDRSIAAGRPRVVLWADTFTDSFSDTIGPATLEVLDRAGFDVVIPSEHACCGLTWISTGQLDGARKRMSRLLDVLGPYAEDGLPILGLEPSCTATLRSDLVELLPDDPRAAQVARSVVTLAELLSDGQANRPDLETWLPDLSGVELVVQPHCHQHSVMGFTPDQALLAKTGATITVLAGCCGLAGNFGLEKGHYEVSVAVAENALLPALRSAPDAIVLADGLSCRTQTDQLAGRPSMHLAELLTMKTREDAPR